MREDGTLLKFQKNSSERRKTNPTITNSLEMVLGPIGIAVGFTHDTLDILTNKPTKMRRDQVKRKPTAGTMKLEQPTNDNTKRILIPNKPRLTI
jgi:hypothetical protein